MNDKEPCEHATFQRHESIRPVQPALRCRGAGDHERLGDQAYGQARYDEALTEYRAVLGSHPDARVWAKARAAALRAGDLRQASAAGESA